MVFLHELQVHDDVSRFLVFSYSFLLIIALIRSPCYLLRSGNVILVYLNEHLT